MRLLFVCILIIPIVAHFGVTLSVKKYKGIKNSKDLTGREVAEIILKANGLEKVYIVETAGDLTDHYDPKRKVVRLSKDIYEGNSIASLAIAAHECGHAIQDKEGYNFMRIRSFIFPIVNIATKLSYFIIMIGLLFEFFDLIYLGILFSALGLLFQIVTLPVEFNASSRAKDEIIKLINPANEDNSGIAIVLFAAAMTYVAGVLTTLLNMLRLLALARGND